MIQTAEFTSCGFCQNCALLSLPKYLLAKWLTGIEPDNLLFWTEKYDSFILHAQATGREPVSLLSDKSSRTRLVRLLISGILPLNRF